MFLSVTRLAAQQNTVMIQVLDGYTGVAIARHPVSISLGTTASDASARKNVQNTWTDERGILILPLPSGSTGWLQLWTSDMHPCDPHAATNSFSLAKISATGVQAPNACSKMAVKPSPGHFIIFLREFTSSERAASSASHH
jgi:hypothetical protein